MKLLVCDVEGTIFKAKYKIAGTEFASTMWQPLAQRLGESAIEEEMQTQDKWNNNEYNHYIEWVDETVEIHKRHGLHIDVFNNLIDEAEYNEGVIEFFQKLDRTKYVPVLISGGFQELVRRAQRDLNISYGYGACEYYFDDTSGLLSTHCMTPCDFEGKYNYVSTLFDVYNINPRKDWIFIGDGKNDIHIAKKAPLSFGIGAHKELAAVVMYNVNNFGDIHHQIIEEEEIILLGQDELVLDEERSHKDINDDEYVGLIIERNEAVALAEETTSKLIELRTKLNNLQTTLNSEMNKRKVAEIARVDLENKHKKLELERTVDAARVAKLDAELKNATVNARAETASELDNLKTAIDIKNSEMQKITMEIEFQNSLIDDASKEITDYKERLTLLETINPQLQRENNLLKKSAEVAQNKKECADESRRKELQGLWPVHFPCFSFNSEPIRDAAKLPLKDRIKLEEVLRELHESRDPRTMSRGKLDKTGNDHLEVRLADGFPARVEYKVLSGKSIRIEIIKFYKHNEKYMQ